MIASGCSSVMPAMTQRGPIASRYALVAPQFCRAKKWICSLWSGGSDFANSVREVGGRIETALSLILKDG